MVVFQEFAKAVLHVLGGFVLVNFGSQPLFSQRGVINDLFDPAVNLWDLAFPSLLFERTGAVMVYASGRPVVLSELMGRSKIPEPIYAGSAEVVEILRQRIIYKQA